MEVPNYRNPRQAPGWHRVFPSIFGKLLILKLSVSRVHTATSLGFLLLSTRSVTKPLLIALKWFINFPAFLDAWGTV